MPASTRERQGDCTLLDICLALHGSNTGASDPLKVEEEANLLQILRDAVRDWEPPIHSRDFDMAVLNLIRATIEETDRRLLRRAFVTGAL